MDSYGDSSSSGERFNPLLFVQKPRVILRLIGIICAIVVFACIADKVYPNDVCYYNFNNDACNYGIAIGVIAFIDCLAFLVVDVMFDQQSNAQVRKYMVVADFIFSVMWSIMWFVGFCFLTDMWRRTDRGLLSGDTINNAQAAIAFSFFSIVIWVALAALSYLQYHKGLRDFFPSDSRETGTSSDHNYSSIPGQHDPYESYQKPQFADEKLETS
ncbi:synaptogyrin-2-like [Corticium candelabrum]|uniref:synaptogyrin-2-like n=1 Tax=Corticium candelabrum TaxID=121492 RepID=UPI002E316197|nr:synaptogyrin-2-like [Corticium candelabrum]